VSDVDIFGVARKRRSIEQRSPREKLVPDPIKKELDILDKGELTPADLRFLRELNQEWRATLSKHGFEIHYSGSRGPDYPLWAWQPDGQVIRIDKGPPGDPDRYLKDYLHRIRKEGYVMEPNPNWGWGDYDPETGWK
jgi:hypothetical protein